MSSNAKRHLNRTLVKSLLTLAVGISLNACGSEASAQIIRPIPDRPNPGHPDRPIPDRPRPDRPDRPGQGRNGIVIDVEVIGRVSVDGDGYFQIDLERGLAAVKDAGGRFTAIARVPLRLHYANGQVADQVLVLAPSSGQAEFVQLPGRFNRLSNRFARVHAAYAGRPQRGNAAVVTPIEQDNGVGFHFQDGCCGRPGVAYIDFRIQI